MDLLPSAKAATQGSPQHPVAEALGSAEQHGAVAPGIEGCCHASVPDPVGNGPAGLLLAVQLHPGLPSGGHRLVLQSAQDAQLNAACCFGMRMPFLQVARQAV